MDARNFMLSVLCISELTRTCAAAIVLNVSLVAVGYIAPIGFSSLVYLGPPMSVATEHVAKKYNDTMRFKLTFLYDPEHTTCPDLNDNAIRLVSEWHYRKRKESDLTIYIVPACVENTEMPYFQTQWNTLWISTVYGRYLHSIAATTQILDRHLYPTWIFTNYFSTSYCSELYVEILNKYGWTSTFFVIDTASPPVYYTVAKILLESLKKYRNSKQTIRTIATTPGIPFGGFRPIMEEVRNVSRVVLYFGHATFLRQFLILAASMNMTNGEYVYIAIETMNNKILGLLHWQYNDSDDQTAFQAFQSLLIIHPRDMSVDLDVSLGKEFLRRSHKDYNFTYTISDQPFITHVGSYLAVAMLAQVLNELVTAGDVGPAVQLNGTTLASRFLNRTFPNDASGGTIYMDDKSQRRGDMMISYFAASGRREPLLQKIGQTEKLVEIAHLTSWANGSFPPRNEPLCGYSQQYTFCQSQPDRSWLYVTLCAVFGMMLIIGISLFFYVRYIKRTAEKKLLLNPWWQIAFSSLRPVSLRRESRESSLFFALVQRALMQTSRTVLNSNIVDTAYERWPQYAIYQGKPVVSVGICRREGCLKFEEISIHQNLLQLLRKFHRLEHLNLCRFYGLSISSTEAGIYALLAVSECPTRGTLVDISSSFIHKDFTLTSSLIVDYLEAVEFIHSSALHFHGKISISTCWIDKHFTLKVADLGYDRIATEVCVSGKDLDQTTYHTTAETLYYRTTEEPNINNALAIRAIDTFSSGFIIYEILSKGAVYRKFHTMDTSELQNLVACKGVKLYQEAVDFADLVNFERVLRSCWHVNPMQRPNIQRLRSRIANISPLLSADANQERLVDKIRQRLSDYSTELEHQVAVKTNTLKEEMIKCDAIIGQILPRTIVQQLRAGHTVSAEIFRCVTLMFADLYGLADLVPATSPEYILSLIGQTEVCFDQLASEYDVHKIEATGDCYLVASGLPVRIGNGHIQRIATFASKLMETEPRFGFPKGLRLRIGIHSGICAAGVVGQRRPRYCLMCSQGLPGRIHISCSSKALLVEGCPAFRFAVEPRGLLKIKGKLEMATYWLIA